MKVTGSEKLKSISYIIINMNKFKIERENTSLGVPGLNAKHEWIHVGCAKNNKDLENKLLNYILKHKCPYWNTFADNLKNIKIKVINRNDESEIVSTLEDIHNELNIHNLFDLIAQMKNNKIIELKKEVNNFGVNVNWFRGRVIVPNENLHFDKNSYNKATLNGSNTIVVTYQIVNEMREINICESGMFTTDEIPEIAKIDSTINNYKYNTNFDWLIGKYIYKAETFKIINNEGNFTIDLYTEWY
jgi:hypothetical protein